MCVCGGGGGGIYLVSTTTEKPITIRRVGDVGSPLYTVLPTRALHTYIHIYIYIYLSPSRQDLELNVDLVLRIRRPCGN